MKKADKGLWIGVVVCVIAVVGGQFWLLGKERRDLDRARREAAELRAREAKADDAALAARAIRERAQAADAEADLSRFSDQVRDAVRRLEDPQYFKAHFYRKNLDRSYAALFRELHLPQEKMEALRDLLAERFKAEEEVLRLARADGVFLDGQPDPGKLLSVGTSDTDAQIRQLLGDDAYAQFAKYQGTIQTREFVLQPFAEHERFGPTSLTDDQIDQLAESVTPYAFGADHYLLQWLPPPLPPSMDEAAARVLSPDQLAAYQAYKAVWQAHIDRTLLDQQAIAKQIAAGN